MGGGGFRQASTLSEKTFKIILFRHPISTFYSAIILPIIAAIYIGIGQNLTNPNSKFGIADPTAIKSLSDALGSASGGRDTVLFVDNGHKGGDIESVITEVFGQVEDAGYTAKTIDNEADLGYTCKSSFRGTTPCFGAVVFYSSPTEGDGKIWNYTLRGDGALGQKFKVDSNDNDPQIYGLPLQRAIDVAISSTGSEGSRLPDTAQAYGWSQKTEDERKTKLRKDYQSSFINYLGVAFVLTLIGVTYHMSGFIATERESGLTHLIDAMMPAQSAFKRQMVRMGSIYYTFCSTYFAGWVVAGVVIGVMTWKNTSMGIIIPTFILAGFAITSMTLLTGVFWKKAQLSGSVTAVGFLVLGIIAQLIKDPNTGVVAVLSILFMPCNFVYLIKYIARYESESWTTDLIHAPSNGQSTLPGIIHWVFFIIQIFMYPLIAIYVERWIHGVTTGARNSFQSGSDETVRLENMTKVFRPSMLRRFFSFVSKPRPEVVAVKNLSLSVKKGQIVALLGANGSGKSTTLDAIAGMSTFTSGNLSIDTTGGLGIAPQKNVLWDELTVSDHIKVFNELKCPMNRDSPSQRLDLIEAIGLWPKRRSQVKTLSGGQKRKLQLGLMLTGGSAVCLVDEVSSGIDPLSRRKIWDILLAERGTRTIIMTTHFLDEADLLADDIAILSKGTLRAEGSSAELKDNLGAGYRVHVLDVKNVSRSPDISGVEKKMTPNSIIYVSPSSSGAAEVIRALEASRIKYQFSGPTIEDVFLHLAEEVKGENGITDGAGGFAPRMNKQNSSSGSEKTHVPGMSGPASNLMNGRPIGMFKQISVLLGKRITIFKNEWLPYVVAFAIPIIAAGVTSALIRGKQAAGCSPNEQSTQDDNSGFTDLFNSINIVGGPADRFQSGLSDLFSQILPDGTPLTGGASSNLTSVDSLQALQDTIEQQRDTITPAGWWLGNDGDLPTLGYRIDKLPMYTAIIGQNLMNVMLSNKTIVTTYKPFDSPVASSTGDALQLVAYLGIATTVVPGLFGLYINRERLGNMRGLQYSSGARSIPLWASHTIFDFAIAGTSLIVAAVIYVVTSDIWYNGGLLFPVFILYALASVLLSYLWSLRMGSALSTYAAVVAFQGIGFAAYMIAYLFILTYSSPSVVDKNILIGHWVISIFFPVGSLLRSLIVSLNTFGAACDGDNLRSNPGAMTAFGGPILYLVIQSIAYFLLLLWADSGVSKFSRGKALKSADSTDPELANELVRVTGPEGEKRSGLRTVHLTKAFNKFTAVDNVSFGVNHGEVFALLGPNGAGKSTTISLIRGDIAPSSNGGDVFVENISVSKQRAAARSHLGVCPQYDAIDSMTVREHLRFYARLRGISDVNHQVQAVIQAVGLDAFADRMASTLSGGNKRKLSLGIALTGNPSVILLDEPSSGLDAAAKRIMWRTLETIVPGRSILLTTHSMEEADALANRAGILATRMLALGTTEDLRHRFGDTLHVHLVSKTAPHSSQQEMDYVRGWVMNNFPGAEVEQDTYHGQMRFSIPSSSVLQRAQNGSSSAIGQLLIILEENKDHLGIAHHSVTPTTLNQVFLTIVGQHNVQEEGYNQVYIPVNPDPESGATGPMPPQYQAGQQPMMSQQNQQVPPPLPHSQGQQPMGTQQPIPQGQQPIQGTSRDTRRRNRDAEAKKEKPWYLKNIWEFF